MQIKSYEEAVKYLESFIGKVRFEITPEFLKQHDPLTRMRVLLDLLGNPQDKIKSFLVGGTSGKGSTAYLISHILTTAGYKTGLTISPHLQKVNERIQINGKSISDEKFTKMVGSMVQIIELMKGMDVGAPSYFEILIAMAFLYFAQSKVDIAVVEVGMGGEYDATNTLYPLVALLTNVSLDHTNVLGGTVQKIAKTKAGIIKGFSSCHPESISGSVSPSPIPSPLEGEGEGEGEMLKQSMKQVQDMVQHDKKKRPIVISGVKQPSVIKIVEERCKEVGAKLYRLGKDFNFKIKKEDLGGSVFDLITTHDRGLRLNDLNVALLGRYQVENASLAIKAVLQLEKFGFKISEEYMRQALKTAFFPGRFEVIKINSLLRRASLAQDKTSSTLVLDGAHNPTKMRAFLSTLKKLYPKNPKVFIVAFKYDKNIKGMLKEIVRVADTIIVTEFHAKTDMSTNASIETKRILEDIKILGYYDIKKIIVENDSRKALDKALNTSVSLPADATHQALQAGQYLNIPAVIVVTGSLYLVGEVRDYLTRPDPVN